MMMKKAKMLLTVSVLMGSVALFSGCTVPGLQKEQTQEKNVQKNSVQKDRVVQDAHMEQMKKNGGMGQGEHMTNIDSIAKGDLNEAEKAGILKMREEEKLARDIYAALGAKWGQNIFLNITSSEQTHMDEIKQLIDRYELTDPVIDGTAGQFSSAEMQKLYNDLLTRGNTSLTDALNVGATIEDMDIKDLQDLTVTTDNADIKYVYENLMNGSKRHLQSFVKNLTKNNMTYTPQYISQTDYDAIISMDREMGGKSQGGCMDGTTCGMNDEGDCMNGDKEGCGMHDGSGQGMKDGAGNGMKHMQ